MKKVFGAIDTGTVTEYEDGRTYDKEAVRFIMQNWIEKHMIERDQEFTKPAQSTVFCGSWNVNAKKQEGGLQEWICPADSPPADIYAIGFQEIVDLNAMNVAINSSATQQKAQFWREKILECLDTSRGGKYILLMEKYLVGLLLCVFVKDDILPNIMDIRSTSTGVGLMGMMGNKGGVAVRFSLYDSSICIVCAHLAAHRENIAGRNADFKNIMERSLFTVDAAYSIEHKESNIGNDSIDALVMPQRAALRCRQRDLTISDHEIIYWFGDLNYRIDDAFTIDEIFSKIEANQLDQLRAKDQLNIERARGNVFQGFHEGVLTFLPTYKYQPGTDAYDTRPEKKVRAPAWCDRVLWKTAKPNAVKYTNYRRAPLHPSDHKPVSCLTQCDVRTIVESSQRVVFQSLLDILRKQSSTSLPLVDIQGLAIKLEKVYYEQPIVSHVSIRNVGESVVYWHFVPKLNEAMEAAVAGTGMTSTSMHITSSGGRVSKPWITFDVTSGLLLPGETCSVAITVNVDKRAAQMLNAGKDALDDIIVLRVEKSSDFHIAVSASYERSCYGMSLQELVHTLQPVATTQLPVDRSAALHARGVGDGLAQRSASPSQPNTPASGAGPSPRSGSDSVEDGMGMGLAEGSSSADGGGGGILEGAGVGGTVAAAAAAARQMDSVKKLSIPKELWRLVDALWSGNALKEKDLFNSKAVPSEVVNIRQSLDHGTDFPSCSPHSLCEALVSFLSSLPQPLIPHELYPANEIEPTMMRSFCRKFLEELPPLNYNVFVYLLSFLREVLSEVNYNRCTPLLLANMCVSCMTYTDVEESDVTNSNNMSNTSNGHGGGTSSSNMPTSIAASTTVQTSTKDEKQKRIAKQMYMQLVITHLLTTPVL